MLQNLPVTLTKRHHMVRSAKHAPNSALHPSRAAGEVVGILWIVKVQDMDAADRFRNGGQHQLTHCAATAGDVNMLDAGWIKDSVAQDNEGCEHQ